MPPGTSVIAKNDTSTPDVPELVVTTGIAVRWPRGFRVSRLQQSCNVGALPGTFKTAARCRITLLGEPFDEYESCRGIVSDRGSCLGNKRMFAWRHARGTSWRGWRRRCRQRDGARGYRGSPCWRHCRRDHRRHEEITTSVIPSGLRTTSACCRRWRHDERRRRGAYLTRAPRLRYRIASRLGKQGAEVPGFRLDAGHLRHRAPSIRLMGAAVQFAHPEQDAVRPAYQSAYGVFAALCRL